MRRQPWEHRDTQGHHYDNEVRDWNYAASSEGKRFPANHPKLGRSKEEFPYVV